eukprot:3239840-Prymnesium_polylepis.2
MTLESWNSPIESNAQTKGRGAGQAFQWGDGPLRNGSRIWEAAHIGCRVATDCAGVDSDYASPYNVHSTTLQRDRRIQ